MNCQVNLPVFWTSFVMRTLINSVIFPRVPRQARRPFAMISIFGAGHEVDMSMAIAKSSCSSVMIYIHHRPCYYREKKATLLLLLTSNSSLYLSTSMVSDNPSKLAPRFKAVAKISKKAVLTPWIRQYIMGSACLSPTLTLAPIRLANPAIVWPRIRSANSGGWIGRSMHFFRW